MPRIASPCHRVPQHLGGAHDEHDAERRGQQQDEGRHEGGHQGHEPVVGVPRPDAQPRPQAESEAYDKEMTHDR